MCMCAYARAGFRGCAAVRSCTPPSYVAMIPPYMPPFSLTPTTPTMPTLDIPPMPTPETCMGKYGLYVQSTVGGGAPPVAIDDAPDEGDEGEDEEDAEPETWKGVPHAGECVPLSVGVGSVPYGGEP